MRSSGRRRFVDGFLVLLALAAAACSGNTRDRDDKADDNTSDRPPKVGFSVMVKSPTTTVGAGRTCPTQTGVQWDIGRAIRSNGMITGVDSPTPQDYGTTLEDGEGDAALSCRVGIDDFDAIGSGIDPQITVPDGLVRFTFAMAIGAGATGTMSLYTPRTLQIGTAGGPECTLTAVHEATLGALWADFSCPLLVDPTNPSLGCEASGTLVLEYCATE